MKKYCIELKDETQYEIDFSNYTEEEAKELALEWWSERMPEIKVILVDEN